MPTGLIQNHRETIMVGLNGHNAKVFSGIEQIFVVQLSPFEKTKLIKRFYKAIYADSRFWLNKLAFNGWANGRMEYDEPVDDSIIHKPNPSKEEVENYEEDVRESETLFDEAWVIPIDPKKSKFNVKTQGQTKGKSYLSEITAYVKGSGRVSVEFFHSLLDTEIALIFKDANGNFRLLFDPVYSVEMDVEQDSGEGIASDVGFTVKFTNESKVPPIYIYGRIEILAGRFENDGLIVPQTLVSVYTGPRPDRFLDNNYKNFTGQKAEGGGQYMENGI